MKYVRFIPYLILFITIQLIQLMLNVVFLPFEFNIEIFLIFLVLFGYLFNSEKIIFPIFLTGIFYDLFFSTNFVGVYSSLYIFILLFVSYANDKFTKSYFQKALIFFLSYLMYNFLNLIEYYSTFFTFNSILNFSISFLIFISLEKLINR